MNRAKGIIGVVVIVVALATFSFLRGGVAARPAAFESTRDLTAALAASKESGKPVLAFVTADWCGPCQALKRGALIDPKVEAAIKSGTEAVYVDATGYNADAESLGVKSIPVLVVLRPGDGKPREVSRLMGDADPEHILDWLAGAMK